MIPAFLYQWIFLLLVTIMTFVVMKKYKYMGQFLQYKIPKETGNIILVIFLIFFIGLRPVSVQYFCDMANTSQDYYLFWYGEPFHFDPFAENLIFENIFHLFGSLMLRDTTFYLFNSAIYFGCTYLGIRRLFPEHKLAAYLVFLAAFSSFSYCTNGFKAGSAASIFIWGISYHRNWKICIPLVLLSWGFHHSMELPVAAYILTILYKKPKYYFYAWCFCALMAIAHVSAFQSIFAGMSDEKGAEYLKGEGGDYSYMTGFRPDFLIYSAMPILVGYYAIFKKKLQLSKTYTTLLNFYLCTNGVWLLCMYASYTNRIAYLSWFIYPIVLIYPFLNENWGENKYRMFYKVAMYHLSFTLFMELIYYQILH